MGFQLRSKGSSPCLQEAPLTWKQQQNQNLINKINKQKEELASYTASTPDSLKFTRSVQVPNVLGNNKRQSNSLSENMFGHLALGYNTKGTATANQGGLFSDTKTIGGTTLEAISFSDGTPNTVTKKDINKTLRKFGGAKVENNVLTPVTTHENIKTINRNQYDHKKNLITRLESLLNKNTNSEAQKKLKKETFEATRNKRVQELTTARSKKKAAQVSAREQHKAKLEEKRAFLLRKRAEEKEKRSNKRVKL